ncbi:universal stress protein [Streptomyces scopuliridis]|uniref:Universal stress protein n=1 Tax=Streptomyces scopuliridis TaxID=452529 RepID=A0ACD4ZX93_9ACTN|nr:universal stress protein [Streptomyces scopuliridis]WSC02413.1 universal stress protein [Streptomyces scopuliridis]WSC04052.1 universal stress protein [Streptomyces scopuliridis]
MDDNGNGGTVGHGRVVVGTDGSDNAMKAVLWAAREAAVRHRPLVVVYGTQIIIDVSREVLDKAMARVEKEYPEVPVTPLLNRATAAESLVETAGDDDLLVVGSRGLGGFNALLLGSVGLRVAARSRVPVVVVRGTGDEAERPGAPVVAAVRNDGDRAALYFAAEAAKLRVAPLHVVSACQFLQNVGSTATVVDDVNQVARGERETTSRLVAPVREDYAGLDIIEETVPATSAAGTLVEMSGRAALLVMGARRPRNRIGSPLGHVTHTLLQHSACPVTVIPRV